MKHIDRFLLGLSIIALVYLIFFSQIDAQSYAGVSVIYELLWLPVLLLCYGLPILILILLLRKKVRFSPVSMLAMIISIANMVFALFGSR